MNNLVTLTGSGPANLEYLKNRKQGEGSLVTNLAKEIFEKSQAETLGIAHYLKKYATGTGVFVSTIALPVAVAGGTIYYSLPSTKQGWVSFGVSGAGAGLTNKAVSMTTGINIGSKLITLMSMALIAGATFASSTMMGSYTEIESEVKKAQEQARHEIARSLTETYNEIAQILMDKSQTINNPHELFLLKAEVEVLEKQRNEIHTAFAKLGLNGVQSANILAQFSSALSVVQGISLAVDAGKGSEKFNFELMTMEEIPLDRAIAGAIPTSVRNHVQRARDNQLGVLHSIRKYVDSAVTGVAAGTATAAAVALAGSGAQQMLESNSNTSIGGAIVLGAAGTGLFAGVKTIFSRFQSYIDERSKKDAILRESYAVAKDELKAVYKALADSLNACDAGSREEKAASIRSKLPAIEKQMKDLQILGLDIEEILAPLQRALA